MYLVEAWRRGLVRGTFLGAHKAVCGDRRASMSSNHLAGSSRKQTTHAPPHLLPTLHMHPYRYFLQPKEEVMTYLESGIKTCDSELKRLTSSREGLVQAQEALKKELLELTRA